MKGKIVALLFNAPARLPSEPRAYYASADHKLKNAADHGAVALITLLGPDDVKRFPWEQLKTHFGRPTLTWLDADGSPVPSEKRLQAAAYLSPEGSARLFAGAPITFDDAVEAGRRSASAGNRARGDADHALRDIPRARVEPERRRVPRRAATRRLRPLPSC